MNQSIRKTNTHPAGLSTTEKPSRKTIVIGGVQIKFGLQIIQQGELTTGKKLVVLAGISIIILLLVVVLVISDHSDLVTKIIDLLEKMIIFFQFATTTSQSALQTFDSI